MKRINGIILTLALLMVGTLGAWAQQKIGSTLTCNGVSMKFSVSGIYVTEKKKENTGGKLTWEFKGTVKPGSTVNVSMEKTAGGGESKMAIDYDYQRKGELRLMANMYELEPKTSDSKSISIANDADSYYIVLDFRNKDGNKWSDIIIKLNLDVTDTPPSNTITTTTTSGDEQVFTYNKLHYKILSKKTVEVTGDQRGSYEGRVDIPSQVKHKGVTYQVVGIGQNAFANQEKLTDITLPKTLQYIETNAFQGTSLFRVTIPGDKTSIKQYAFRNCLSLDIVTCSGKKPQCSASAFYGCKNMRQLRIRGINTSNNGKKLNGTPAVIKVIK